MTGAGRGRSPGPLARVLMALVLGYRRWVGPLLGPRCRFTPSCSAYALEALRERGAVVGSGLVAWRLLRCQPFHPGGYDPVPVRRTGRHRHDDPGRPADRPAEGARAC